MSPGFPPLLVRDFNVQGSDRGADEGTSTEHQPVVECQPFPCGLEEHMPPGPEDDDRTEPQNWTEEHEDGARIERLLGRRGAVGPWSPPPGWRVQFQAAHPSP